MQHITRRAGLGLVLATPALAQWVPARSIRLIAPYTPGGGVDTTSRLIAGPMGALLGQAVVVENRAGAGGSLGAAELARSAPDGLTVMVDALAHTVNPALIRNLPFDYATAFTPITQLAVLPQIMIVPNALPVTNLGEFLAYVRTRPGLPYGSSGNATAAHLAGALLLGRAGASMEHVPYRGGTAALPDVIAGNISFVFGTVSSSLQLVREGRVRALGVTTAQRIPSLPDVATIAEQGFPGFELNEWNGFWGPASLPAPVLARLHDAAVHALADATVKARFEALGAIPVGNSSAEFGAWVTAQRGLMAQLVRDARIESG
jgi:tripartite-type tricarboxylate transporter receptor subunit TctC